MCGDLLKTFQWVAIGGAGYMQGQVIHEKTQVLGQILMHSQLYDTYVVSASQN